MTDTALVAAQSGFAPPAHHKFERGDRQIRYMAQSVLLEEAGTSGLVRAAILVVCGVVTAFIIWAWFTRIDEVAVAHGQVVPSGSVQVVQHLEGGIIRDILVEERSLVETGQVLVRLDPTAAMSELNQLRARRISLQLRSSRLRAFAEDRLPDYTGIPSSYRNLVADQWKIYFNTLDVIQAKEDALFEQESQKQQEIEAVLAQQRTVRQQLGLINEEIKMRQTLLEKGLTSKVLYLNVKREHANTSGEMERLRGQEQAARKGLLELASRVEEVRNDLRQESLQEMGQVEAEMAQVDKTIDQAEDRVRRLEVISPVRGYVQDLKIKTVGAVLPAGGILMNVVPVDEALMIEARISTRDVGHVSVGQPVTVKVTSYDFARYGSIQGILQSVSATTYLDEKDGTPYYKGMVELAQPYVGDMPGQNPVMPGMTVQADIITGDKTLLQYLLKPIYVSLKHAFHER